MKSTGVAMMLLLLTAVTAIELRGVADPKKKEAKKADAKAAEGNATGNKTAKPKGPCEAVKAIEKEMEKMDPAKNDFLDKHFEVMKKTEECRNKEAEAATKKAEKKYDPESEKLGNAAKPINADPMAPGKTHEKTDKAVEGDTKAIDKLGFLPPAGGNKTAGKKKGGKKEEAKKK